MPGFESAAIKADFAYSGGGRRPEASEPSGRGYYLHSKIVARGASAGRRTSVRRTLFDLDRTDTFEARRDSASFARRNRQSRVTEDRSGTWGWFGSCPPGCSHLVPRLNPRPLTRTTLRRSITASPHTQSLLRRGPSTSTGRKKLMTLSGLGTKPARQDGMLRPGRKMALAQRRYGQPISGRWREGPRRYLDQIHPSRSGVVEARAFDDFLPSARTSSAAHRADNACVTQRANQRWRPATERSPPGQTSRAHRRG